MVKHKLYQFIPLSICIVCVRARVFILLQLSGGRGKSNNMKRKKMIVHSTYNSVLIKWMHDKVSTGYHHCIHTRQRKKLCSQKRYQPNIIVINMITLRVFYFYFDSFHEKYLCQLASVLFMAYTVNGVNVNKIWKWEENRTSLSRGSCNE